MFATNLVAAASQGAIFREFLENTMPVSYQIGPNTLVVDGDTLYLKSVGPFFPMAAEAYCRIAEQVMQTHREVYFVTDLSQAALMPSQTRRYLAEWARQHRAEAVIYYGASLPLRAVAVLLLNAARLFSGGPRAVELFLDSEQEAKAAIAQIKAAKLLAPGLIR